MDSDILITDPLINRTYLSRRANKQWRFTHRVILLFIFLTLFWVILLVAKPRFYDFAQRTHKAHSSTEKVPTGINATKNLRIFAFIHTFPPNHLTRARAVESTWAKRLDDYVFSTIEDKKNELTKKWIISFSNTKHNRTDRIWLWDRVRAALKRMYTEKLNNYDWFMKADDDTFVVVENLRHLLSKYDPSEPWCLGELVRRESDVYPSGGAGYVLSREALRRLIIIMNDSSKCSTDTLEMEDIQIGKCFKNAGLKFINNIDARGQHTMIPINLVNILPEQIKPEGKQYLAWYTRSAHEKVKEGSDCCSDNLIAVHYVDYTEMYLYDYLLYKVKIRGRGLGQE